MMRLFNYSVNSRLLIITVIYLSDNYYLHNVITIMYIIIKIVIIIISNIGISIFCNKWNDHSRILTRIRTCKYNVHTTYAHMYTCNAHTYSHIHTQCTQGILTDTQTRRHIPSPYILRNSRYDTQVLSRHSVPSSVVTWRICQQVQGRERGGFSLTRLRL